MVAAEHPDIPYPKGLRFDVELAPLTSLELGGPARYLVEARTAAGVSAALRWAAAMELPVLLLGGGTNVVVADQGFHGLVVRMALRGIELVEDGGIVRLTVAAGEGWDEVVQRTVALDLAGIECLSGIPGTAGATPIQNVGAYGQEVSDVIESVRVIDRATLAERVLGPDECSFSYRGSLFREQPDRYVVLALTLRLRANGRPVVRYPELERAVREQGADLTVAAVRRVVLELRRAKSMVLDPDDPNRRSVGSFFVNPVMSEDEADSVAMRVRTEGVVAEKSLAPRYPAGEGRTKIPAAWLIERAGFGKGLRRGAVGMSTRHALALVHHSGGHTADLVALAADIRRAVHERFGVLLQPEPVFVGFAPGNPLD